MNGLSAAWRYWRSDDPAESVVAVVLLLAVLAPYILTWYRRKNLRGGGRRTAR